MAAGVSLVSKIPIPEQSWRTNAEIPIAASIKVGDIQSDEKPVSKKGFVEQIKDYFLQKRLQKLENIPPTARTPAQQAELEANKQSLNYVV